MDFGNPILNTDSYKFGHFLQYPPGTRAISSYIETRGQPDEADVLFFGLQMFLKDYLARPVTRADVDEAEAIVTAHGQPFDRDGWLHIVERFGGYLPLRIEALPEGTLVRRGVPLVQVVNTDPRCFWLTSHIETALLRAVWYPSTVASQIRKLKRILQPMLEKTADNPEAVLPFSLHDFGARGATSMEQAGLGGAAHLVHFRATDTMTGILYARRYYDAAMAGLSMPASEHSTMTTWRVGGETRAYANMVDHFAAKGSVSVVSDSFDINYAVTEIWGKELREKVKASGGRVVIRPDSGDPIETPVHVVRQLDYHFGSTLNGKGYKVLHPSVRVLQGDGLSSADMGQILGRLEAFGFSAENISFAMGSGILQKVNRDTYSFAMKANGRMDDKGRWHDVFKRPATMNVKASKAGRQAVVNTALGLEAVRLADLGDRHNHLIPIWENGRLLKDWSLAEVRERAR
ncbi:nicotinamide phosphoribosyltransferase [Pararhizobium capsulatum DSM 1112]|uniref:Nicotinamide phosphoribosyltransferase n=1 Tax=Pararhizobium capsulatum DSM 1112 TaxID=1121113 RepID=A0ABU0BKG4_9HYPH|nr:nicotinate phosphoribosyltransferase [Pararhizobium capsulatum]MDQ0318497.1 nicotinamide phosphoribosyltransferase [Pararhizobium capsulatum DSM 1112]